ncbi:hypothetical protein [Dictyobacter arantiisoli]|uniref:Uncharacterized protein n=1 Tax=Dictyobacter arantiisoli TaxID=2014874 RepID=A0A5A5TKZ0_9CHLR|nr:hypothetical protein [Dictyobacter arantiisoli]GCF11759.1 hypothetical protein KDI_53230 [Dictyobacter arantiisoli]
MLHFYEQYQQGYYQEVYDDLLALQDQIYKPSLYEDASAIMRSIMQRVRINTERIMQRLPNIGFVYSKGLARHFTTEHEKEVYEKTFPLFQPPKSDVQEQVALLEQLSGSLPLSLRFFYEEVGYVNFVGAFSSMKAEDA